MSHFDRFELLSYATTNDLRGGCRIEAHVRDGAHAQHIRGSGPNSSAALIDSLERLGISIDASDVRRQLVEGRDVLGDPETARLQAVISACNEFHHALNRAAEPSLVAGGV